MMHRSNPSSFSSAEFWETSDVEEDIPYAWLDEHFMAITDDRDIPESWVELAHFVDITDDEAHMLDASFVDHQLVWVPTQPADEDYSTRKVSRLERIFLIINVLIELLSAAFDQLSSASKPKYALMAMLMSFVATIICIIELAYKAGKEKVIWRWQSKLPSLYYSSPTHKRFGTFPEMISLVCAILQTVLSAVAYTFYIEHANYPLYLFAQLFLL